MTNVESRIIRTLTLPSLLASSVPCIAPSHLENLVQTSPVHPNSVIRYALSHINLLISSSKQPPYLPIMAFHSHSEIYCHATFHRFIYYDTLHHCHIALHDHVVDIVFVSKPPCIVSYMSLLLHCPSQYTAGGIHIESYFVLVSSCNH